MHTSCAPLTVSSYSPSHAGELTSFNVAQECICECNGTSTGIFCRGANPMREFLAVASTEPDVEGWKMSKWSVGHGDPWRTTARFGSTCVPVSPPHVYVWHRLTWQRCWDTGRAATTAQQARHRIRAGRGMPSASIDRACSDGALHAGWGLWHSEPLTLLVPQVEFGNRLRRQGEWWAWIRQGRQGRRPGVLDDMRRVRPPHRAHPSEVRVLILCFLGESTILHSS
jgi:hypothetical protein